MAQQILPQEELHRLFDYKDGNLYWKIKPANRTNIGDVVGCIDKHNLYIRSRYKEKCYLVHRLIFAWHYGYYPKMIDHIDGNRSNNKIENLRAAENSSNQWNQKLHSKNTSGYKNVVYNKFKKVWVCRFKVNGKHIMKGYFKTPEEANELAIKLRKDFHGEFAKDF
jgi:hypothetical protein